MKMLIKSVVLVALLWNFSLVAADFLNFASQNSAITCADGVQFNVGKNSNLRVNGTLGVAGDRAASLSGGQINFAQGFLRLADGREVLLNALLDPANDICLLQSGALFAHDGITFTSIGVEGMGNVIAGVLHVTDGILVAGDGELTVDLQNALESDIFLSGGKLVLARDLFLAAGVKIVGPGAVDKQQFKIYVQPGDDVSWAQNLSFQQGGGVDVLGSGGKEQELPPALYNTTLQINNQVVTLRTGQYRAAGVHPIEINENMTLNGGSSIIHFMTPIAPVGRGPNKSIEGAQLRIAAGKKLTLKNIVLSNIAANAFDFGDGAVLAFGENVTLEFGSDVFFTKGLFKILNTPSGEPNVVRMRGVHGRKLFVLSPTNTNTKTLLDLNGNSMVMQDLELVGAGFIAGGNDTGSVALAGNAVLNVERSTDLNVDVEDTGNVLVLTQDALTLSGAFSFSGLSAENSLTVRFVLNGPVADKEVTMLSADNVVYKIPVKKGNPLVVFDGDSGVFLTSEATLAGMIFADASVSIVNGLDSNTNGFVVDQNSYLKASDLEILGHPIQQGSSRFALEAHSITGDGIDQGFIRLARVSRKQVRVPTAFAQHCAKRRACRPVAQYVAPVPQQVTKKQVHDAIARVHRQQRGVKGRSAKRGPAQVKKMKNRSVRVLDEPAAYLRTVTGTEVTGNAAETGTVLYNRAVVKNFESAQDVEFTITLQDGAQLQQKRATTLFVDAKHKVNIIGFNNRIELFGDAVIDLSGLHFDRNAGLVIHCNQVGAIKPTIILCQSLDLPAGATLVFSGAGTVVLQDRTEIVCNGTLRSKPVFAVSDGIEMSLAAGAAAYVGGIGRFALADNGRLRVDNNAKLHIADGMTGSEREHDIDFGISGKSTLLVAMDAGGRSGLVRFAGGQNSAVAFSIDDASLVVGPNGTLAFSVMRDAVYSAQRGLLRSFSMRMAQVRLAGTMIFGPNRYDDRFVSLETSYDFFDSVMQENGAVVVLQHNPIKEVTTSSRFLVRENVIAATSGVVLPEIFPRLLGLSER